MSSSLYAKTLPVTEIGHDLREQMFRLMSETYDCIEWERFISDLEAKDAAILLFDRAQHRLRGFSTLKRISVPGPDGRPIRAMYSGDTVVERAYWGQKVLGVEFLKNLWKEKLKHPFQPLYWLLISKGYKTYLLMANNFETHFPRFESATPPEMQTSMDRIATAMFGDDYDPASGLVVFKESLGQLKPGIADVSEVDETVARAAFFARKNPTWSNGTELVCIAEMTFFMPLQYALKKAWGPQVTAGFRRLTRRLTPRLLPGRS